MKEKIVFMGILSLFAISCSMINTGDPYANTSGPKTTATTAGNSIKTESSKIVTKANDKKEEVTTTATSKAKEAEEKAKKAEEAARQKAEEKARKAEEAARQKAEEKARKAEEKAKKEKNSVTIDEKFDETDQKIVDFIAEKVKEDESQIKKITIDGVNKLQKDKNIRMTKREYLARTYQIIRDNKMTSYYLASARLLNQMK